MSEEAVLVTGGAGFIGSHLVDLLVENGHPVYVLDDLSTGNLGNLERWSGEHLLKCIRGDIRRPLEDSLTPSALGDGPTITTVFHLAARVDVTTSFEQPKEDMEVNYIGTLNVLDFALRAGAKRVVFSSSASVYGDVQELPVTEDASPNPLSPYGLDKLASEHLLRLYSEQFGIRTCSLRFFNVFGPRQNPANPYSGVISKFIQAAMGGDPLLIYGDGAQTRDFVYVKDVAEALYRAATSGIKGVYNVGSGKETSIMELARQVVKLSGKGSKMVHLDRRKGEILRSLSSIDKIASGSGWEPGTDLAEGLKATMRWFQTECAPSRNAARPGR